MSGFAQIQEFFVEGKNRKSSHVLLHISEPSTSEELPKGSLFALIEITGGTKEQIEELQACIDTVEQQYYTEETDNPEELFEQILEQVNKKSHHMLQDGVVDAVIGVMIQNVILLSYHGKPVSYVFYQHKHEYKVLPIITTAEDDTNQLFSSVISGTINMHDYFFVSTPSVSRYFSEDRIQKIITARDAQGGAGHLERVLANLRSEMSFGGIVAKLISAHDLPKTGKIPAHLKQGSKDSIYGLVEAQDSTAETLNPSILQSAKSLFSFNPQKPVKNKNNPINHNEQLDSSTYSTTPFIITLLKGIGTVLLTIATLLLTLFERIAIAIRNGMVTLWYLITNHKNKRVEVFNNVKHNIENIKQYFVHLPILNKILLVGMTILIVTFITSVIIYDVNKRQAAQEKDYLLTVQNIQNKLEKAQAQITYKDTASALTLLREALETTNNLPTNTDQKEETQQTFLNSLTSLLNQVRNVTTVSPTILTTITSTTHTATPNKLARVQNTLIAFGENDTLHYIVPTVGGNFDTRDHSSLPPLLRASTPKENDTIVFIGSSQSAGALDITNNTISPKSITYPTATSPNDIALYNRRAYILDSSNNQIYKHNPTANGYDKGVAWIQNQLEGSTVNDGVSIAIDGDVFVLTNDGKIQKYVAGDQESFSISGLDPLLDKPTEIFTYTDVNYLYILEPTNKRIVVLDKTGKLIKQYTATEWKNPTSMNIDEKNKTGYVLDSNIIYSFQLN